MLNTLINDLKWDIAYNEKVDTQRAFDQNNIMKKQLKVLKAAQAKLNKIVGE